MTRVPTALLLIGLTVTAVAQDTLRLANRQALKGEVITEDEAAVTFLTQLGEVRTVPRDEIADLRRGPPLDPRVQARLDEVGAASADELVEVARWAIGRPGLKTHGERVARRALAKDFDHAAARDLLGHVRALDTWYPDRRAADRDVRKRMTAEGRVKHGEGWVLRAEQRELKAAPDGWMVEGERWRRVAEVMEERGHEQFRGAWYAPEELELIPAALEYEELTGVALSPARSGPCIVFSTLGRDNAKAIADELLATRVWFMETFRPTRVDFLEAPVSSSFVLADDAGFRRFAAATRDRFGISASDFDYGMSIGNMLIPSLGHLIHADYDSYRFALVSAMSHAMMNRAWVTPPAMPEWIWSATAHLGEIAVLGETRMQYVTGVEFGEQTEMPPVAGRGIPEWIAYLEGLDRAGRRPHVREMFNVEESDEHALSSPLDTLSVVLLAYLVDQRNDELVGFISGRGGSSDLEGRVHACFGQSYDTLDEALREWERR